MAAAAHAGRLSDEQLRDVAQLADEGSDVEWAERAPDTDPGQLAREVRCASKPSADEQRARHEARGSRTWWTPDQAMLHVRGELPDVTGARFEQTINDLVEQCRPTKGGVWDTHEHRAADALLEQLRANATIEPVLVDESGDVVDVGRAAVALSPKIARAVLLRDGCCRMPGCGTRHGLEVHHLTPRSWGGTDDIANLAVVCPAHHRTLVPHGTHGTHALTGNPNHPDGLRPVDGTDRGPP